MHPTPKSAYLRNQTLEAPRKIETACSRSRGHAPPKITQASFRSPQLITALCSTNAIFPIVNLPGFVPPSSSCRFRCEPGRAETATQRVVPRLGRPAARTWLLRNRSHQEPQHRSTRRARNGVYSSVLSAGCVFAVTNQRDDGSPAGHNEGLGLENAFPESDAGCGDVATMLHSKRLHSKGIWEGLPQQAGRSPIVVRWKNARRR